MATTDVPETAHEYLGRMLRSCIEADRLVSENINDPRLREAHIHTAANGFIAAIAMHQLMNVNPGRASDVGETLQKILTAGDIAGPAYRAAKQFGYDPDQWIAEHEEHRAKRREKRAAEPDTIAVLTDLAGRWEEIAKAAPDLGDELLIDEPLLTESLQIERAHAYRQAAADVRAVLATGRIPHGLMTSAELGDDDLEQPVGGAL